MGDLKRELEVYVRVDPHKKSLRGSKLSWISIARFTTN